MGAMTSIMVGLGVVSAGAQVYGGFAEGNQMDANADAIISESNYNAGVYDQQVGMIEEQKNLKISQDKRAIRFMQGATVAMTAHKGIELSGSPLAILIDSTTEMSMDMAINAYNYDMEKYGAQSAAQATRMKGQTTAAQYRRAGDTARIGGVVGGLTTLFRTGVSASESSFGGPTADPLKKISYGGKGGYGSRASAYKTSGLYPRKASINTGGR